MRRHVRAKAPEAPTALQGVHEPMLQSPCATESSGTRQGNSISG